MGPGDGPEVAVAHIGLRSGGGRAKGAVVTAGDDSVPHPDLLPRCRGDTGSRHKSVCDPVAVRAGVQRGHGAGVRGDQDRVDAVVEVARPGGVGVLEHRLRCAGVHPVMLGVLLEDPGVAVTQAEAGRGFPRLAEPPQRRQACRAGAIGQQRERPTGVDRRQLGVVPNEQHLGPGRAGLGGDGVEGERSGERRFVDDHELARLQRPPGRFPRLPGEGGLEGAQRLPVAASGGGVAGAGQPFGDGGASAGALTGGLEGPLGGVLACDAQRSGELGGSGR